MKITLISGAASGLGKEFAKLYLKDKNNLLLVDINEEGLNKTKEELTSLNSSLTIDIFKCDLSNIGEIKKLVNYTKEHNYFVNNLVNSAGFGDREDFLKMDIEKNIKLNHVNCDALLYLSRVYGEEMAKNKEGHIINVSSIAGFMAGPYMCTYHASKAYVLLLSESIGYELKKHNVHVLTLCPGPFNSNFVKKAHNDYTFKKIKPFEANEVALKGYKASLKNKKILITGLKNKLTVFITRLFSRSLVTSVSAKTMKEDA